MSGVNLHLSRLYYDRESRNRKALQQVKPKYKLMLQDNFEFGQLSKLMLPFTNPDATRFDHTIDGDKYHDVSLEHESLMRVGSKVLFSDICIEFDDDIADKYHRKKFYKVAELLKEELVVILKKIDSYRLGLPDPKFIFDRVKVEEATILGQIDIEGLQEQCFKELSEKINEGKI